MSKNNDDRPIGELSLVDDFLPPPLQLIPREETVQVTLSLNKKTIAQKKRNILSHIDWESN